MSDPTTETMYESLYPRDAIDQLKAKCARLEEALKSGKRHSSGCYHIDADVLEAARFRDGYMMALKDRSPDGPNAAEDMRERAVRWCEEAAQEMGAVDGYDYNSGMEYAYRKASIKIAALPIDAAQEGE
ncbi:MAG: hypothetical protein ACR2RF_26120 [Geminicoccaceae bacterium]